MNPQRLVHISKFLSKHLRHAPQQIGLHLDEAGWAEVAELLAACAQQGLPLTRAELNEVVAQNDKQRFAFDASGTRIRASQGHSIAIDLQLTPSEPPATLYHGTAQQNLATILQQGLRKMRRQHVHLSRDVATALTVGARHGKAVVLQVDSGAMQRDGHRFFLSANGVWLVDAVPPHYLQHIGLSIRQS